MSLVRVKADFKAESEEELSLVKCVLLRGPSQTATYTCAEARLSSSSRAIRTAGRRCAVAGALRANPHRARRSASADGSPRDTRSPLRTIRLSPHPRLYKQPSLHQRLQRTGLVGRYATSARSPSMTTRSCGALSVRGVRLCALQMEPPFVPSTVPQVLQMLCAARQLITHQEGWQRRSLQ